MRSASLALVALLAFLLAGCSTPVPSQNEARGEAAPQSLVQEEATGDRCNPGDEAIPMIDPIDSGTLSAAHFAHMRDLGSREFATGEATVNADGVPATYTVAPGDVASAVAARFCITEMELDLLNAVRFCGTGIYPGDVYNLDPYTVATAGGRASAVCDNEITFSLP